MLNEKTQNPRGNHIFESSKFAILDPQRVRATNDNLVCIMQTTQVLKQPLVFIGKHTFQIKRFYTPKSQWRISGCKNILKQTKTTIENQQT